jgi:hypothetical protein
MVSEILVCFVLASLRWLTLWAGLRSTRLRSALKTLGDGCFSVFECMFVVVVFEDALWVASFVGF